MRTNVFNLSWLSRFSQACLALGAVIFMITYFNPVLNIKSLPFSLPILPSSSVNIAPCQLSLQESDSWFCESDINWKRRKELHHLQDQRNRHGDNRPLFFQDNWEPTIQCEFERRLGNSGDGGKWICDVHRFDLPNSAKLLIYSFGSNGDFSFERAVKQRLPQADIHTFDMGVYECPRNICTFHQARLGGGKDGNSKSLRMIIKELNHQERELAILKVDVEGGEYDLFEELFDSSSKAQQGMPRIRQILFEIHLGMTAKESACERTHRLFELFRSNSFAIYHKEVNLYDAQNVFEYGLIRLNPAFFNNTI